MQSRKSGNAGRKSAGGSSAGKKSLGGRPGFRKNSRSRLSGVSHRSALLGIPRGVPCAIVSAAFRGPRLVADFQRRLVEEHLPLARRIARYFASRVAACGPSPEELRSAAFEGLCGAVLRYVESRGSFERFAGYRIKREVTRRIAVGSGPVSRPRNAVERARAIERQRAEMAQDFGGEVSDEDLASRLTLPVTPRHHRQRRTPETAEEVRLLDGLLRQQHEELDPNDQVVLPEEDLEADLPSVCPSLDRFLDGWTIPEIAVRSYQPADRVRSRIRDEIRKFFRA